MLIICQTWRPVYDENTLLPKGHMYILSVHMGCTQHIMKERVIVFQVRSLAGHITQ